MGDIIVGHGENRYLGHGTRPSRHNAGSLIEGSQVAVEIARESLSGRNLALGGGDLTHGLGIGGHVRQYNQYMHSLFKGQILGQGKGDFRGDKPLHHRVVGQVDKHGHMLGYAALLKGTAEEISHIIFNAHGAEHNGKFLIRIFPQGGLLHDLGSQLVMGKTVSRKDGKLLSANQGGQPVNG